MWEQLVDSFLLFFQEIVETLVHLVSILLDEALNSLLMQSLIEGWVLSIDVNLTIGKRQTFHRLLIEHYVEWYLFTRLRHVEEGMVLHLLPRWS